MRRTLGFGPPAVDGPLLSLPSQRTRAFVEEQSPGFGTGPAISLRAGIRKLAENVHQMQVFVLDAGVAALGL